MVTDAYSRKIVGYSIDATMETTSIIDALKMATAQKVNVKLILCIIQTEACNIVARNM